MIVATQDTEKYSHLIDRMFRLRARVFRDRLNWDVTVVDGRERDRYDDELPVYIICHEADEVQGSVRLLPTTGPILLDTLAPGQGLVSPTLWECSRYCVDDDGGGAGLALVEAVMDVALQNGMTGIIGQFDQAMVRFYRLVGCEVDIIGRRLISGHLVYTGLHPISEEIVARVKARLARLRHRGKRCG